MSSMAKDQVLAGSGVKAALYAQPLDDPRAVCKLVTATVAQQVPLKAALEEARHA